MSQTREVKRLPSLIFLVHSHSRAAAPQKLLLQLLFRFSSSQREKIYGTFHWGASFETHTTESSPVDRNRNDSIPISSRDSEALGSPEPLNNLTFKCAFCDKLPCSQPCCYLTQRDELQHVEDCSSVVRAPMSWAPFPSGCEGEVTTEGRGVGWGCRLSVTAEWSDCRSFLTEFDRRFQTVQTGRYGYINRRARSSCPLFLRLCLSRVMPAHKHVHVWTGAEVGGRSHSWSY